MRSIMLAFVLAAAALVKPVYAADDYLDCYKASNESDGGNAPAICGRLIATGKWKGVDLSRLLSNRALAYIKKNQLDLAEEDLNRALRISPNYVYGYDHRGEVWRLRGEYDKAIVDYNHAIRVDPSFVAAYLDRGNAFKALGNLRSARADYQAVLDMPGKGRPVDEWAKREARKRLDELAKQD